jgi:hypothetical protein
MFLSVTRFKQNKENKHELRNSSTSTRRRLSKSPIGQSTITKFGSLRVVLTTEQVKFLTDEVSTLTEATSLSDPITTSWSFTKSDSLINSKKEIFFEFHRTFGIQKRYNTMEFSRKTNTFG